MPDPTAYRTDRRPVCAGCSNPLADGEGVYDAEGRLGCRRCAGRIAAREATQLITRDVASRERKPMSTPELLLVPGLVLLLVSIAMRVDHELGNGSCSELGCIGILLACMGGIAVTFGGAVLAVVLAPVQRRSRVLLVGFGTLVLLFGTCASTI